MSVLTPGEINTLLHRNGTVLWKGCGTLIAIFFGIYCAKSVFFFCVLYHIIILPLAFSEQFGIYLMFCCGLRRTCSVSRVGSSYWTSTKRTSQLYSAANICIQCFGHGTDRAVCGILGYKIKRTDLPMQKWGSCGSNDTSFSPEHTWHMCYGKPLEETFFALYNNTASHVALPLHFFLHFRFLPYCFQSPMHKC